MSAFYCGSKHFSAMVNAGLRDPFLIRPIRLGEWVSAQTREKYPDASGPELLYFELRQENIKSLRHRYGKNSKDMISDDTVGYDSTAHFASDTAPKGAAIAATLKGCNCYDYQSCEHSGWTTSLAKQFTDALIFAAYHELPEYEAAHTWPLEG